MKVLGKELGALMMKIADGRFTRHTNDTHRRPPSRLHDRIVPVPHSGSGVAPMSSLSGVELLGFWEFGTGGLNG